jgi:hypothetical protein
LLGLRNPPRSRTSMVGPSLPDFTIAPCVDSLMCYRSIRRPKSILQNSPKSSRRSSMVSNFTTSSSETTKQPTALPGSGLAANQLLQKCSHWTHSSPPFDLRKMARHPHQGPCRVMAVRHLHWGPCRAKVAWHRLQKSTWASQPSQMDRIRSMG